MDTIIPLLGSVLGKLTFAAFSNFLINARGSGIWFTFPYPFISISIVQSVDSSFIPSYTVTSMARHLFASSWTILYASITTKT